MGRRIAMISDHASPLATVGGVDSGGQNVYVDHLARALADRGHEVDVFTRRDDPSLPTIAEWVPGVRIVHVDAGPPHPLPKEELLPHVDAFSRWMLRHCSGQRYDIVHANFFVSAEVARRLKRFLELPYVVTFHALGRVRRQHQAEADVFPDERFEMEERSAREADLVIAECPQDRDDLLRLYGVDPGTIVVVPAGFDPRELFPVGKELARAVSGFPAKERLILHLGRLVPRKGADDLIRALARIPTDLGPVRLLIAGGETDLPDPDATPEIGRLAAIAAAEGVDDRVTFLGRVARDRLRFVLSAADVFATTPWYEPFGITPLEAMACGTPVVGSAVGGIRTTVRDGETGYLVPPHDPDAVACRLEALLRDPDDLARLRGNAVRYVNARFTWDRVAAGVERAYERVLGAVTVHDDHELAIIDSAFRDGFGAMRDARRLLPEGIMAAVDLVTDTLAVGGKVLVCGNGGSAAEAQHFAAELTGRFRIDGRRALPVIALTSDTAFLTAWSNDASFDDVFARQVEALGREGDMLIGLSTSGRSENVTRAFRRASELGLHRLAVSGGGGGPFVELADSSLVVPGADTQRIQEMQLLVLHVLCDLVERRLEELAVLQPATVAAAHADDLNDELEELTA